MSEARFRPLFTSRARGQPASATITAISCLPPPVQLMSREWGGAARVRVRAEERNYKVCPRCNLPASATSSKGTLDFHTAVVKTSAFTRPRYVKS